MSINTAWQGRRYKTKKYKKYEEDVGRTVPTGEPVDGEVAVLAVHYLTYYKRTDVGNLEKPLTDIIDKLGYLKDDKYIKWNSQIKMKAESKSEQHVDVFITPYTNDGVEQLMDKHRELL